jgi:beta-phosphoglucomutase-like phosphatase (HAD superfamily)/dTDP-glucose pyrophosphorylase
MNKALLFDLDGVLVDSRELHFEALNLALAEIDPKYVISLDEQATTYEGLTTKVKLEILNKTRGFPADRFKDVWRSKQNHTAKLFESLKEDPELIEIFELIESRGFKVGVVSNSIRQTLDVCLEKLGIAEYIDLSLSNEEVLEVKPSPSGYKMAMIGLKSDTLTTAIFEDSIVGRLAAEQSGAKLVPVDQRKDLTKDLVVKVMDDLEQSSGPVFNILIPMAGAGSRFAEKGYEKPKFFIDVCGKPMIQQVVSSLGMSGHFIYVTQSEHAKKYGLKDILPSLTPDASAVTVIEVNELTSGAATTTLLAEPLIDNDAPLIICNSDQLVQWASKDFLTYAGDNNLDGCIAIFRSNEPRWSYVETSDGQATRVAEKEVISDLATVGIYYWKHGSDYVKYAHQMVAKQVTTNGEFYVCPVYNEAIQDGKNIGVFMVDKMISLGTPEDLEAYVNG